MKQVNDVKKPYESPALVSYGSVAQITEAGATMMGTDGGMFPNSYAS